MRFIVEEKNVFDMECYLEYDLKQREIMMRRQGEWQVGCYVKNYRYGRIKVFSALLRAKGDRGIRLGSKGKVLSVCHCTEYVQGTCLGSI